MSLRSVSVGLRNFIGFGALTLCLLITGGVALSELSSLKGNLLEVKDVWMGGLDLMAKIKSDRQLMRLDENEITAQPSELSALTSEIRTIEQRVRGYDKEYEGTIILDEDRRLFGTYQEKSAAYEKALDAVLAGLASGSVAPAVASQSEQASMP